MRWESHHQLWALIPAAGGDVPGHAVTPPIDGSAIAGKTLVLNLKVHNQTRTKQNGNVVVELLSAVNKKGQGEPISGFTLDDCTPVSPASGDAKHAIVTWKGGAVPAGHQQLKLRFVLLRARLYSFEWV